MSLRQDFAREKKYFGQGVFIYANPALQTLESIYNFDFNLDIQILLYTDTKIIPFFQKLEEKSVDFRSLLNKGSKIRKARHKSSIRMRVNIDFL